MSKVVTRSRHSLRFQNEAVRLAEELDSQAEAAKTFGIAIQTIHNWMLAEKENRLTANVKLTFAEIEYLIAAVTALQDKKTQKSKVKPQELKKKLKLFITRMV